jgi:Holliday junction resolvase-like predicted endonuclease
MNQRDLGAWSELLASADLMKRGYDVLRAVSQSCPCDIVAFKDDKDLMRIQVRTGSYNPTGMATAMVAQKDASKFDVLAIVMKDGKVFYEPNVFQEDNSMVNPATAASVVKYAKPERAPWVVESTILLGVLGAGFVLTLFGWGYFLVRVSLTLTATMNGMEQARKWSEELDSRVKARVRTVNTTTSTSAATAGLPPPTALQSYGSDEMVEEQPSMDDIMEETSQLERHMKNQRINYNRAQGIDRADELTTEEG